jgi:WD40 repeat protein
MERSHEETILGLNFFKDDNNLVSASRDRAIRIWSIDQDVVIHKFTPEHENKISCVAVSNDKSFLATGSYDRSIEIYDLNKKVIRSKLRGPDSPYTQLLFEVKRNRLVSLNADKMIRVWDFEGNILKTLQEPTHCISMAENGTKLIAGGQRIMIYDLDSESETPVRTISINYEVTDLLDISVSHDGTHIVAINNRNIFVWDYTLGEIIATFARAHEEDIRKVAITPDNSVIVTAGQVIKTWSLHKQECIGLLESVNNTEITGLTISGGGKFILAGRSDGSIEVWDWKF